MFAKFLSPFLVLAASMAHGELKFVKVSDDFLGAGVQFDPYFYEPKPAQWKTIFHRLDECRPGFFRVVFQNDSYCDTLAADGSPVFKWDSDPGALSLHKVYEILDYAQSRHIHVLLGEWGYPSFLVKGKRFSPEPGSNLWKQLIVGLLDYLVKKRGYDCIWAFDYFNEPNGDWSGNPNLETWVKGVTAVSDAIHSSPVGKRIGVSGPSATGTSGWIDGLKWLDRAAKLVPNAMSSYNLHWYADDDEILAGAIETNLGDRKAAALILDPAASRKRFLLGESGVQRGKTNGDQQPRVRTFEYGVLMVDYFAQVARSGWLGATFWDLDDAMHPVHWEEAKDVPGPLTLKVWGFWNTQGAAMGTPKDETPRPPFLAWSLLSNCFPKGCSVYRVDGAPDSKMRLVASYDPKARRSSMAIINESDVPKSAEVPCDVSGKNLRFAYDYFESTLPNDLDQPPVARELTVARSVTRTMMLPGRGCLFLTSSPLWHSRGATR